jgi:hypothetical protein
MIFRFRFSHEAYQWSGCVLGDSVLSAIRKAELSLFDNKGSRRVSMSNNIV